MKKSIYFHIDEFNRDTIVAAALYKKLSRHFTFFFGNRIDEVRLKKYNFDIYIFPTVERARDAFGEPENCEGKIFILPNESISGSLKVKRRLELHLTGTIKDIKLKRKWLSKVSKFFLWGNSHYKVINNYSRKMSKKSVIIGHPRHDKDCYKKIERNENSFSVGIASRFDLLNIFDNRLNFEAIYNAWFDKYNFNYSFSKKSNIEHQWFNAVLDFRFFLDIVKILNNKNIVPEIRPHPRENINNWKKFSKKFNLEFKFKISKFDETFVDWINRQKLIISTASTSLYDCALLNKNVLVIDKLSPERAKHGNLYLDDFDPIIKYFARPKNIREFTKKLNKNKKIKINKSLKKLLFNEVNYPYQNNSLKKISDYLIKNESKTNKFNIFKLIKGYKFIFSQNYTAFKFTIKKILGFREVGSIFSLGILRYKMIKKLLR